MFAIIVQCERTRVFLPLWEFYQFAHTKPFQLNQFIVCYAETTSKSRSNGKTLNERMKKNCTNPWIYISTTMTLPFINELLFPTFVRNFSFHRTLHEVKLIIFPQRYWIKTHWQRSDGNILVPLSNDTLYSISFSLLLLLLLILTVFIPHLKSAAKNVLHKLTRILYKHLSCSRTHFFAAEQALVNCNKNTAKYSVDDVVVVFFFIYFLDKRINNIFTLHSDFRIFLSKVNMKKMRNKLWIGAKKGAFTKPSRVLVDTISSEWPLWINYMDTGISVTETIHKMIAFISSIYHELSIDGTDVNNNSLISECKVNQ